MKKYLLIQYCIMFSVPLILSFFPINDYMNYVEALEAYIMGLSGLVISLILFIISEHFIHPDKMDTFLAVLVIPIKITINYYIYLHLYKIKTPYIKYIINLSFMIGALFVGAFYMVASMQ